MTARIAVGVSGAGSNLRALHVAAERRELGGDIVLVFADRACAALDWAALAAFPGTLVLYMGVRNLARISERLIDPDKPG